MKINDITNYLEKWAPLSLQESYDNAGLLVGKKETEIKGVLITLDVTEAILDEAISKKCNLIIAHHPIIFKGLKNLTGQNSTQRIVEKALREHIALYAIHTNLDNVDHGVNAILSQKLHLQNNRILSPMKSRLRKLATFCPLNHADKVRQAIFNAGAGHIGNYDNCSFNSSGKGSFRANKDADPFVGEKGELHFEEEVRIETIYPDYVESAVIDALLQSHPYEEVAYDIYPINNSYEKIGAGMIGELAAPMSEIDFLNHAKTITGIPYIRHSQFLQKPIHKVALCGGAGSFLIQEAIRAGADAFLTGDIKYHEFFDAESKILVADIGHFESEQFVKELIYSHLIKKFSTFAVLISETNTNSINYL